MPAERARRPARRPPPDVRRRLRGGVKGAPEAGPAAACDDAVAVAVEGPARDGVGAAKRRRATAAAAPGRHVERLHGRRGARAAAGTETWPAPVVPERRTAAQLVRPGRIAGLGAHRRAYLVDRLADGGRARRTMRPRQVAVTGAVAALLGLLLNAGALQRGAETSQYGAGRTVALDLLGPLAAVAHATGLDRPRAALDAALGNDAGSASQSVALDSVPPSDASVGQLQARRVDAGGGLENRPPPSPSWSAALAALLPASASGAAPAVTRAPVARAAARKAPPRRFQVVTVGRVPSASDPLRVWVGGDSVAGYLGLGMVELAGQRGDLAVHSHYQVSTGLSRPDYYDWPAHLEADMQAYDPEVVVYLVGANDDQPVTAPDGSVADFGTPAWSAEYSRRVGAVMDRLLAEHRMVVWVGLPVMRASDFDSRMQAETAIYRQQAALRPGVVFVDSRPLLSGPDGAYSPYLADAGGQQTLMRAPDGIHLSPDGGRLLASDVLDVILRTLRAGDEELPLTPGAW